MGLSMYTYTGQAVSEGVDVMVMVELFKRAAKDNPKATLDDLKFAAVVQWSTAVGPGQAQVTSQDGAVRTIEVAKSKKRPPLIELLPGETLRLLPAKDNGAALPFTVAAAPGGIVSIVPGSGERPQTESDPRASDTPDQAAARAWLATGKFGTSSMTLSHTLLGVPETLDRQDGPHDPSDFARCVALVERVPALRARMGEMVAVRGWEAVAPAWDELETLYQQERHNPDGKAPRLYDRLKELRDRPASRPRGP